MLEDGCENLSRDIPRSIDEIEAKWPGAEPEFDTGWRLDMDANRAFELLGRLAFTRMSGTDEELKAAQILAQEAQAGGR